MPAGIYPIDFAERCKADAGKPWTPSNGTEGWIFIDAWCTRCRRDKVCNGQVSDDDAGDEDLCPILGASFRDEAAEWQYDANGQPCCTAYEPLGEPGAARCPHTLELPLDHQQEIVR